MSADLRATPVDAGAPFSAPDRPVRVVLADDECLFRASLRQLLSVPPSVIREVYGVDVGAGFEVVGEAGSGHDTIRVVQSVNPDLLLLDLSMPCMTGLDAMRGLEADRRNLRAIMLAGRIDRADLLQAVQLGVRGMLLKDAPTEVLFEAIMSVLAGRCWVGPTLVTDLLETVRPLISSPDRQSSQTPWKLTARERQVLAMVAAAHGNKEIARRFAVSEETIKHHLTRLFAKVGASTRLELAMLATQHGIVASEPELDVPVPVAAPASASLGIFDS
jgi:two-component system, NarL family, nitrate/nitrite response regulator NarL